MCTLMDPPTFLVFFTSILGLTLLSLVFFFFRRGSESHRLPPGPPKLPIIGNLHNLSKDPHLSLTRLSKLYGPLLHLQLGQVSTIVVSSARVVEELFKNHDLAVASRPKLYSAKHIMYGCNDVGFSPYGPFWRQARKICALQLFSNKQVRSLGSQRAEEVGRLVGRVKAAASAGGVVNLTQLFVVHAMDTISNATFGKQYASKTEQDKHKFHKILQDVATLLGGFSLSDFFHSLEWVSVVTGQKKRLVDTSTQLTRILDDFIQGRLQDKKDGKGGYCKEGANDLLDLLLELQENGNLDIPLTGDNVKAILLDMFAAGSDTTLVAIDWAMTELIKNPNAMKKAQEEIGNIVKDQNTVSEDDLHEMTYLKAVIKEVLRIHPPSPLLLPKESTEEITIGKYTIPSRTRIFVNAWAIGHDPESWENPETFMPERFLGSGFDFRGQNFEFIPFGVGRRICPAVGFATANIELVLAQLLHSFDWELPFGMRVEDMDMTGVFGLAMPRASELLVVAKPRFA